MSANRSARSVLPAAFLLASLATTLLGTASHESRAADGDGAADAARLDPRIRFAVLTEAGPLLVHVDLLFDGAPWRILRGELVDDILRRSDPDGDGRATWDELLKNPPPTTTALFGAVSNPQVAMSTRQRWDTNKDGLVDAAEIERLVSGLSGGTGLTFAPTTRVGQPDLIALLDADGNGRLSPQELDEAAARLLARDADDDEDVDMQEILAFRAGRPAAFPAPVPPIALLLDLAAGGETIVKALRARYGTGTADRERRPLLARRLDELDRDANGTLDDAELARIAGLPGDLVLRLDLARSRDRATTIAVVRSEGLEIRTTATPAGEPVLDVLLPGGTFQLVAALPNAFDLRQAARQQLGFFDKDANGYIEKSELPQGNAGRYQLAQFERWDADGDGKVYEAEIAADLERGQLPRLSQATLASSLVPPSPFAAVDRVPDGRLGLREVRTVGARLRALDRDGDGTLQPGELPESLTVVMGRGNAVFGAVPPGTSVPAATAAPKWFVHMDRNGDGDVSPREFPGPVETFRRLDRDGDGLLDPTEAAHAANGAAESRR